MYSVGGIISTHRKKKGLHQQDLADELAKEGIKISSKAVSSWERNLAVTKAGKSYGLYQSAPRFRNV